MRKKFLLLLRIFFIREKFVPKRYKQKCYTSCNYSSYVHWIEVRTGFFGHSVAFIFFMSLYWGFETEVFPEIIRWSYAIRLSGDIKKNNVFLIYSLWYSLIKLFEKIKWRFELCKNSINAPILLSWNVKILIQLPTHFDWRRKGIYEFFH